MQATSLSKLLPHTRCVFARGAAPQIEISRRLSRVCRWLEDVTAPRRHYRNREKTADGVYIFARNCPRESIHHISSALSPLNWSSTLRQLRFNYFLSRNLFSSFLFILRPSARPATTAASYRSERTSFSFFLSRKEGKLADAGCEQVEEKLSHRPPNLDQRLAPLWCRTTSVEEDERRGKCRTPVRPYLSAVEEMKVVEKHWTTRILQSPQLGRA